MQTTSLDEQTAPQKIIITGASSGIGFETAIELAINGHEVLALARSADKLANLQQIILSLNPEANIYTLVFDIVNDDYQDLYQFIEKKWGKFNVLINNAGVLVNKPFLETSAEDFAQMFESNLLGHVQIIRNLFP